MRATRLTGRRVWARWDWCCGVDAVVVADRGCESRDQDRTGSRPRGDPRCRAFVRRGRSAWGFNGTIAKE